MATFDRLARIAIFAGALMLATSAQHHNALQLESSYEQPYVSELAKLDFLY